MNPKRSCLFLLSLCACVLFLSSFMLGQETTAGLQGTVKDATGAAIPGAEISATSPYLAGGKTTTSDAKGYYRFANLPPGPYTISVKATGFNLLKKDDLVLEVGHLPTVDLTLSVGATTTVVEVSSAAPQIDVTTTTTQTNITSDVINYVPRGTSFQSVIQFAPSARNEPLMGNTTTNGSGSVSPGNGSNGNAYGYSVAGGSDSENSYLVEGQETANLIGGYSHTNVPFDFIQEVQVKSSGIEAEHGGSLGGVVNVIMKKGTPQYHGSVFAQYNASGLNATSNLPWLYDPSGTQTPTSWGKTDPAAVAYGGVKDKTSNLMPGFTFGGPLLPFSSRLKDRLFFFTGFQPELNRVSRTIDYGSTSFGKVPFSQNTNTYYTTARIDAKVSEKVRVFASWLYQLQRQNGENLPGRDSTTGIVNQYASNDPSVYAHTLGFVAPNTTFNTGADITLAHNIVSTTRFGYYFENYHDFGFPTTGVAYQFQTSGMPGDGATDAFGNPLPAGLQQPLGAQNLALNQNFTSFNANKAVQLDQDIAFFKSGWGGTHNFKFGYQLNRMSNNIRQAYNVPYLQVFPGNQGGYSTGSPTGDANCVALIAAYGSCQGQYGYVTAMDFGTAGTAISYNHGVFAQVSWQVGHGVTIDAGIRFDKEYLPGEAVGNGAPAKPIDFSWTDKVAPRIGAAWDVFRDGKMKVFGDYGVFYDVMKLNLAISSFGGQYWQNCTYALNTSNLSSINLAYDSNHRYCAGADATNEATFGGGKTPAGLNFIENLNYRAFPTTCATCSADQEGVAPGLKPYQQHESVFGVDYQIARNIAFEARYDRRRLDHVIEDAAIYNPDVGETFVVINPGQGTNATYSGFCNFLYGTDPSGCASSNGKTPPNTTIPAARSYDGVEFRVTKASSNHWLAMASYTYSRFRGNYTGLTSSDIADGGYGGRNAPNNSRSFDEPYFQYNSMGGSSSGLLPTDRPNVFKGYAYYELGWLKGFTTDFGLFQTIYQGSPNTTYMDVGASQNAFPVDVFNRGKWADITQNPNTGVVTVGNPYTYRNPWYNQTDFNLQQSYKISEAKQLQFAATFTNLFNERSVVAVNEQVDSSYSGGTQYAKPGGQRITGGTAFYAAATNPWSVSDALNGVNGTNNQHGAPITINSLYGKPLAYQQPRNIRLSVKFTF
ncbi:MAG TPA: carboxypeptidase regulatory-like domain-containing protein [Edaphobacter sp.]